MLMFTFAADVSPRHTGRRSFEFVLLLKAGGFDHVHEQEIVRTMPAAAPTKSVGTTVPRSLPPNVFLASSSRLQVRTGSSALCQDTCTKTCTLGSLICALCCNWFNSLL